MRRSAPDLASHNSRSNACQSRNIVGATRRDDVDVQSIQAQKAGSDHGLQYEGSPSGRISKRLLYPSQSSCMMRMVASTQQP